MPLVVKAQEPSPSLKIPPLPKTSILPCTSISLEQILDHSITPPELSPTPYHWVTYPCCFFLPRIIFLLYLSVINYQIRNALCSGTRPPPTQDKAFVGRTQLNLNLNQTVICQIGQRTEGLFRGGIDVMKVQRLMGMSPCEPGF